MSVTTKALIITKCSLADNIYYLKTERPKDFSFFPGQFARLGLSTLNESDPVIWRAQTIACGAKSEALHFYVINLKGEKFSEALEKNDNVKISGFGNFELKDKKSRPGRNPKTGEEIPITARRVVTFKPGQKLKSRVEAFAGDADAASSGR